MNIGCGSVLPGMFGSQDNVWMLYKLKFPLANRYSQREFYFTPYLSLIRCASSGSALMRSISSATICLTSLLIR